MKAWGNDVALVRPKVQHLGLLMGDNRQELAFEAEVRVNTFLAGRPFLKSRSFQFVTENGAAVGMKLRKLQVMLQGDHSAANIERHLGVCMYPPTSVKVDAKLLEQVHALLREWSGIERNDEESVWSKLCVIKPSEPAKDRSEWFLTYNPTLNKVFETRITSGVQRPLDGGLPFVSTQLREIESKAMTTSQMDNEDVDMYIANGRSEATARCATSCILCEVCWVATEHLVEAEELVADVSVRPPRPKDLKKVQMDLPALMCSGCSMVVHVECLGVPSRTAFTNKATLHHLARTKSDWFCPACLSLSSSRFLNYGYQLCPEAMTRKEYEFRSAQVARRLKLVALSIENIERVFWATCAQDVKGQATVLYASDLDSTEYSGGVFPDRYGLRNDSWDLRDLALNKDSLLRHLAGSEKIKGVARPWLYLGSHLSAFCWHAEDQYLCSISYLHEGSAKVWYTVPGHQRALLEQAIGWLLPDLASANRDLEHHLTTMVDPVVLRNLGINVGRAVQRPNEFIVTFPQAYHCGFNTGVNLAEAVNVAFPSWLPHGIAAARSYAQSHRPCVFCLKELAFKILCAAIQANTRMYPGTDSSIEIIRDTIDEIEALIARGLTIASPLGQQHTSWKNDTCSICHQITTFVHCPRDDGNTNLCPACALRSGTATSVRSKYLYEEIKYTLLRASNLPRVEEQKAAFSSPPPLIATPKRRGRPRKISATPPKDVETPSLEPVASSRRSTRLKRFRIDEFSQVSSA